MYVRNSNAGDFSNGKRKGVTLFLGEFFELRLSVDGTLSRGAERYRWNMSTCVCLH